MNAYGKFGSEKDNEFLDKIEKFLEKLQNGTDVISILDSIEEQYIYRLFEILDEDDDEYLENIILSENDKIDVEYSALLLACEDMNIDVDAYTPLRKIKAKVKKIG